MKLKTGVLKMMIPVIIVMIGFAGMKVMERMRPQPQKETARDPGALVETLKVKTQDLQVAVRGTGSVQPRREALIAPEVGGKVVRVAAGFVAGGFFAKGDLLFEIDPADYFLAAEKARAGVTQAEFELAQVESRARIAVDEWRRIADKDEARPNPLVLYQPQLKNARAQLASAAAALEKSLLDIERSKILAPFNCRIRSESLDVGQYLKAGTEVAVVIGTDSAEIVVPLPLDDLRWLRIPGPGRDAAGSKATVQISVDGRGYQWQGEVARDLGDVDSLGRMARLVVGVRDPYHLDSQAPGRQPDLAMGMFVEVLLQGEVLNGVIAIPSRALREKSTVWLMNAERRLEIRTVSVLRREHERVLIGKGLAEGEQIVLTYLSGAAQGMQLRQAGAGGTP